MLRRNLSLLGLVLIGLLAGGSALAGSAAAQDKAAKAWLGLIAGPAAASETVLAADMASLFAQSADLRVLPMLGDAGAGNLALLLDDPHVDIAFVSTDALAEATAKQGSLADKIELVARLAPQEIHVLARADIGSLSALSGRQVSFGPAGSASAVSAASLFKALGVKVEALNLDASAALERLKQGAIAAIVIVGGKPSPLVSAIPANAGIHLLPISFGAPLEAAYLPTRLQPEDYPNLIQAGGEVATVATGMVLLAAASKSDPGSSTRVTSFVNAVFPRFAELQAQGRHPKWREVNLAASLPGFKRSRAAEAWLGGRAQEPAKPMVAKANASQPPAMPESLLMSKEQKESLFKKFIEWQRGKLR
ncbi:MAG: hypothetical protein MUO37_01475 [Methyloceanibacter sp.]|nr:hypothetical protein [Methyloceanibacter sp.]